MILNRIAAMAAMATATVALSTTCMVGGAQAAAQDGVANNNEFVFYYNSNQGGSLTDFATAKSDLVGFTFVKPGSAGYGQAVKNNAASVANLRADDARVYYNSNYAGAYDHVNADSSRNLVNTYNDNASFRWQ